MGFKARQRDAIAMLDASHRRQEQRLGEGARAAQALAAGRGSDAEVEVVGQVLGFLRKQAARHVADEEESIFPRLPASDPLAGLIRDLAVEHREHDALLSGLGEQFAAWRGGVPTPAVAARFATGFERFCAAYREHIDREDRELLPAIRRHISSDALGRAAAEMRARRPAGSGRGRHPRASRR